MRAVKLTGHGGAEVLEIGDLAPQPLGEEDLRVALYAAAVNPADWKIRRGYHRLVAPLTFPWVLGLDGSGVVEEVGSAVTGFSVGDAVYFSPSHRRWGTYAEQTVVPAREVALKPSSLTHVEAASLPLVAQTAWQCLVEAAHVGPGQRVLVQAGAGGVGTVAIQLARHLGATVITTCSAGNADFCRQLGASEVVDYRQTDFAEVLSNLDVVLDAFGGSAREKSFAILKSGGSLITISGGLPAAVEAHGGVVGTLRAGAELATFKLRGLVSGIRTSSVLRRPDGRVLERIATLVEVGALRPVIDSVFSLEQIREAHARSEEGHARGKIVLKIREEEA